MPRRAAQRSAAVVISRKKARALVRVALRRALSDLKISNAEFARRAGLAESTVTRWFAQRTPVALEAVMYSRRFARRFLVCLLGQLNGARA